MTPERQPCRPAPEDWEESVTMLCMHCGRFPGCSIVEGMIETKDGGPWPHGGWVTDPGAGITCLSYQPRPMAPISVEEIRTIASTNPATCTGCAARKGSEASTSLHTRRDFTAAVRTPALFVCHEDPEQNAPCGGWCRAALQRHTSDGDTRP